MKDHLKMLTPVLVSLLFVPAAAFLLNAQITNQIQAHIRHSFVIGNETLPPGDYTFRIERNSDEGVMTARNGKGDVVAQFNVRQSTDNHRPKHSELVFNKFGHQEFLSKIYEGGSKNGVAVDETSKQEARLMKAGQRGTEHTEQEE